MGFNPFLILWARPGRDVLHPVSNDRGKHVGSLGCIFQPDIAPLKSGSLQPLATNHMRRDMLRAAVLGHSCRKRVGMGRVAQGTLRHPEGSRAPGSVERAWPRNVP